MKCKGCKGCNEVHISVTKDYPYCLACIDDIQRINNSELDEKIKIYVIENYDKYLSWLIEENEKPEYAAEYHSFQETCKDFYILKKG